MEFLGFGAFKNLFSREAGVVRTTAVLPDVTAEKVRALRELSESTLGYPVDYNVRRELVIPGRYHKGEELLAPLDVNASSIANGTSWTFIAKLRPTPEEVERGFRSQPIFGIAGYDGPATMEEALKMAEMWIRHSTVLASNGVRIPTEEAYRGILRLDVRGFS